MNRKNTLKTVVDYAERYPTYNSKMLRKPYNLDIILLFVFCYCFYL